MSFSVHPSGAEFDLDIINEESWEVLVGTSATRPKNEKTENLEMDTNFFGHIDKPRKEFIKTEGLKLLETQLNSQKKIYRNYHCNEKKWKLIAKNGGL